MTSKHETSAPELCHSDGVCLTYISSHTRRQIFNIESAEVGKNKTIKTTKIIIAKTGLKWYAEPPTGGQHTMSATNENYMHLELWVS